MAGILKQSNSRSGLQAQVVSDEGPMHAYVSGDHMLLHVDPPSLNPGAKTATDFYKQHSPLIPTPNVYV